MAEDVTGAQALAQDLRALAAASREANASLSTSRTMIASSESGMSNAGNALSLARGSGSESSHKISFNHIRRDAVDIREILEGFKSGNSTSVAAGFRGLIGRGSAFGLVAWGTAELLDHVEKGYKERKELADGLRDIQKESAKLRTDWGAFQNSTSEQLVNDKYSDIYLREMGYDSSKGAITNLTHRMERGWTTLKNYLNGRERDPDIEKEAQKEVKEMMDKVAKRQQKIDKEIGLGNLGDAEKEEINLMGEMGYDNFLAWRATVGTPGERFYRKEQAATAARLFGAFESPRKGPRSEED